MTTSFLCALPACLPTRAGVALAKWIPYHSPFANTETAQVNKAFVKESDGADDGDEELAPAQRLPAGSKNYMTRRGYDALRVELDQLVRFERPKLVETVAWAAGNGDRSENGDYIYGKKRLREIDRRIRFLTKRLDIAEVADPSAHHGSDQIFFGATVTYANAKGEERTNQFYADPRIPKGGRAELSDYRSQHPAMDRGHQAPAADAPKNRNSINCASCTLTLNLCME